MAKNRFVIKDGKEIITGAERIFCSKLCHEKVVSPGGALF